MTRAKNPPKLYRPQKVVATMQRDTRPTFAQRGSVITQPADVVATLSEYIGNRATEVFVVLFVNARNQIVGYTEFAEGSVAGVTVHPSGIFREALVAGAAAIVTAHNHPSGDPAPSEQDRSLWQRLRAVGQLVGIPVLDNLVIGEGGAFYSESDAEGATP